MYYFILLFVILFSSFIYKSKFKLRKTTTTNQNAKYNHAIILGGSIAGMTTAAYLKKYFQKITIIENDDILNDILMKSTNEQLINYRCYLKNGNTLGRSGTTQSFQIHVLQGEGSRILFDLFPKLKDDLITNYGARISSLNNEFRFIIGDILLNKNLTENLSWFCIDRFTLETILRRHLFNQQQIQWITNTKVTQLITDQLTNTIKGVQTKSKDEQKEFYGDFIVDCTGRYSSSLKWLKDQLNLIVPTEQLDTGTGYVSFVGERFQTGNSLLDSFLIGGNAAHAPHFNKGFLTIPIRQIENPEENSLGILSNFAVYCVNGEYPPCDSFENLLEFVKEYLPIDYYTILKSTKLQSPLLPYRKAFDYRKYVERLGRKWPKNFILLGDSMCVFNPKNGQGMTHACRQARQLNRIFENNPCLEDISFIYNQQASAISHECWLGSTTNDWAVPTLKLIQVDQFSQIKTFQRTDDSTLNCLQPKIPLFMLFLQWYTYWLIQCAAYSGELTTAFVHVVFQTKTPFSLLKPKFFFRILFTSIIHNFNLKKFLSFSDQ